MFRLASILFSMIATTLAGIAVIVTLVIGQDTLIPILIAAGVGFLLAIPATWFITMKIEEQKQ